MPLVVSARQDDSAAGWALALAARLRMIHAGFADEPVAQRKAFVADEVTRALERISPGQKAEFLTALTAQFPGWQAAAPSTAEVLAASELVGRLLARLGELSAEDRARLAREFQSEATPEVAADHTELWQKLGLPAERTPSGERCWRLLGMLLEFFNALDQLAWTLWRNLGVKSVFEKESVLSQLAGSYLAGDHEVSSEQVRQTVERTRRLIAAMLGAAGRAANDVANRQAELLAPEAIEVAARSGKRALESLDAACWREYKQRYSAGATAAHLEAAIQGAVGRAAEDLIGGRTR